MPAQQRTDVGGDMYVAGDLSARTFGAPAGCIDDAAVAPNAGINETKLRHRFAPVYAQDSTTNAAVERRILHVVKGASGTLKDFRAGSVTAAVGVIGSNNCIIDLLKNGATILSATIQLDSGNTAYVVEQASGFVSTVLVAGDVLEFKLVSATGTKPIGVFAQVVVDEDAS